VDLGQAYIKATRDAVPQATICFDPFDVIRLAKRAVEPGPLRQPSRRRRRHHRPPWRAARVALRSAAENLKTDQQQLVNAFRRTSRRVYRAREPKESLRYLYQLDHDLIRPYLRAWITAALRSRLPAFRNLTKAIRTHFDGICAATEEDLSNSRLEGINAKIRLIQRRGYGYHPSMPRRRHFSLPRGSHHPTTHTTLGVAQVFG
jgi:transposase